MAIKIAIANQKGGVGKTTTAVNLADALKHLGYYVLLIDLDPQHNSTSCYRAQIDGVNTIVDLLKGDCKPKEAVQNTALGDIVAGDGILSIEENYFAEQMSRESLLLRSLGELNDIYDFIIMDTPPNLGLYMLNALTAADGCIIPIRADQFSIDGLNLLMDTINDVKKVLNKNLIIYGVLMTSYDARNSLDQGMKDALPQVGDDIGFRTFNSIIRISQDVKKAQAIPDGTDDDGNTVPANRSLFENFGASNAAIDYVDLTKELLEVVNG